MCVMKNVLLSEDYIDSYDNNTVDSEEIDKDMVDSMYEQSIKMSFDKLREQIESARGSIIYERTHVKRDEDADDFLTNILDSLYKIEKVCDRIVDKGWDSAYYYIRRNYVSKSLNQTLVRIQLITNNNVILNTFTLGEFKSDRNSMLCGMYNYFTEEYNKFSPKVQLKNYYKDAKEIYDNLINNWSVYYEYVADKLSIRKLEAAQLLQCMYLYLILLKFNLLSYYVYKCFDDRKHIDDKYANSIIKHYLDPIIDNIKKTFLLYENNFSKVNEDYIDSYNDNDNSSDEEGIVELAKEQELYFINSSLANIVNNVYPDIRLKLHKYWDAVLYRRGYEFGIENNSNVWNNLQDILSYMNNSLPVVYRTLMYLIEGDAVYIAKDYLHTSNLVHPLTLNVYHTDKKRWYNSNSDQNLRSVYYETDSEHEYDHFAEWDEISEFCDNHKFFMTEYDNNELSKNDILKVGIKSIYYFSIAIKSNIIDNIIVFTKFKKHKKFINDIHIIENTLDVFINSFKEIIDSLHYDDAVNEDYVDSYDNEQDIDSDEIDKNILTDIKSSFVRERINDIVEDIKLTEDRLDKRKNAYEWDDNANPVKFVIKYLEEIIKVLKDTNNTYRISPVRTIDPLNKETADLGVKIDDISLAFYLGSYGRYSIINPVRYAKQAYYKETEESAKYLKTLYKKYYNYCLNYTEGSVRIARSVDFPLFEKLLTDEELIEVVFIRLSFLRNATAVYCSTMTSNSETKERIGDIIYEELTTLINNVKEIVNKLSPNELNEDFIDSYNDSDSVDNNEIDADMLNDIKNTGIVTTSANIIDMLYTAIHDKIIHNFENNEGLKESGIPAYLASKFTDVYHILHDIEIDSVNANKFTIECYSSSNDLKLFYTILNKTKYGCVAFFTSYNKDYHNMKDMSFGIEKFFKKQNINNDFENLRTILNNDLTYLYEKFETPKLNSLYEENSSFKDLLIYIRAFVISITIEILDEQLDAFKTMLPLDRFFNNSIEQAEKNVIPEIIPVIDYITKAIQAY